MDVFAQPQTFQNIKHTLLLPTHQQQLQQSTKQTTKRLTERSKRFTEQQHVAFRQLRPCSVVHSSLHHSFISLISLPFLNFKSSSLSISHSLTLFSLSSLNLEFTVHSLGYSIALNVNKEDTSY